MMPFDDAPFTPDQTRAALDQTLADGDRATLGLDRPASNATRRKDAGHPPASERHHETSPPRVVARDPKKTRVVPLAGSHTEALELATEMDGLRDTSWRQTHRIAALEDTVRVLRLGANALALDNACLQAEIAGLRVRLQARVHLEYDG
jgi:hypothetical protein